MFILPIQYIINNVWRRYTISSQRPSYKTNKMHTKNKETQFGNVLLSENIRSFIRYAWMMLRAEIFQMQLHTGLANCFKCFHKCPAYFAQMIIASSNKIPTTSAVISTLWMKNNGPVANFCSDFTIGYCHRFCDGNSTLGISFLRDNTCSC